MNVCIGHTLRHYWRVFVLIVAVLATIGLMMSFGREESVPKVSQLPDVRVAGTEPSEAETQTSLQGGAEETRRGEDVSLPFPEDGGGWRWKPPGEI